MRLLVGSIVVAVVGWGLGLPPAGAEPPRPDPVAAEVAAAVDEAGAASVLVRLATPSAAGTEVAEDLAAGGGTVLDTPEPIVAATVDQAALDELRSSPEVAEVVPNRAYRAEAAPNLELIGAPAAWGAGATGAGQAIAVIDTGVDRTHPWLSGKVVAEACFSAIGQTLSAIEPICPGADPHQATGVGSAAPCTIDVTCAHGTHVAGIAAGTGGTAPGATILGVQVFSRITSPALCGGSALTPCALTFEADLLQALAWVEQQAGSRTVAAANLSVGGDLSPGPCDDHVLKPAIDDLRAVGVATVIASGNYGEPAGISWPACISTAVTVGAVDQLRRVASFSNSSPVLDLLAPGVHVSSSVPGGGTAVASGTSMAAPHVAGAIAVLRQHRGNVPVSKSETVLRLTGEPVTDGRNGRTTPALRLGVAIAGLQFSDVPPGHPFRGDITWMSTEGLTTGYADGTFGPGQALSRQAMAGFLYRLAGEPAGPFPNPGFTDVAPGHPFYREIAWMAAEGIASGYGDGSFGASRPLSRQAMAGFLHRFDGEPAGPFPDPGFTDVPPGHPFHREIAWMAAEDITGGYDDGSFGPTRTLTRQAMSAFLYRLVN